MMFYYKVRTRFIIWNETLEIRIHLLCDPLSVFFLLFSSSSFASFSFSFSFSYMNDYLMQHEMTSSRFVSHSMRSILLRRARALSHTQRLLTPLIFSSLFCFRFFLRRIHISGSLVIHWKYRKLAFNWYSFSVNIRGGVETNNASRVMPLNHCISGIWALEKCSVVVASKFVL